MSDIRIMTPSGWRDVKGTPDGRVIISGFIKEVEDAKILSADTDYAAEDILSESSTNGVGTAWRFHDMKKTGIIQNAKILCSTTGLTPRLTLYLFQSKPTTELDDNAVNVAPAAIDQSFYLDRIDFPAMEDLGGMSESEATPSTAGNLPLYYETEDNSLYGILVTRDAITGEAASMSIYIKMRIEPWS